MSIQWFPGHMNKAKDSIRDLVADIDVVIELLDARAPFSSCNPLLQSMIAHKKKIILLNKSDLADDNITHQWVKFFSINDNSIAITGVKANKKQRNQLIKLCQSLAIHRNSFEKPLRVMIIGIPNVGKSTLINQLIGKKSAKTGDIPAVTKNNQCLILNDSFLIYDTPGMMWQKIIYEQIGNNLAICNSIGKRALDEEILALYLLNYLKDNYPYYLVARYKLKPEILSLLDNELLNKIGIIRGCILSGGVVDIQKTSELIIQDFRDGKIGKISLETPALWDKWIKHAIEESIDL